ncbi:mechanosensitive ion channel domain-containing protein [Flavicella sediminum]|uniref:mechanosensitive ion channel domain-containing protein n=1 Tax=Flavicella sediminum TaxID=2585141 RepID=UPI00111EAD08|nr:mechanosensitive ion channel domain-containing protein [Flavicella sediminum]
MENEVILFLKELAESDSLRRLLIIFIGVVIVSIISKIILKNLNKKVRSTDNKYKTRKIINLFSYILFIAIVLFVYNDKLGNIGTAMGVAGAGIAFALQEVIISIAGWVNIVTTNAVQIGQRVKIGDVKGDIVDIGVLNTTLMEIGDWVNGDLYNGRIVTLTNSFIFKEKVHNYSSEYPFLWDEITIPIRTESDYHTAKKVFADVANEVCGDFADRSRKSWQELANKFRVEEANVNPVVTLVFDENWITFTIRYIVDYKNRRSTKDVMFTKILDEIAKYDAIIMIGTSTLEITNIHKNDAE